MNLVVRILSVVLVSPVLILGLAQAGQLQHEIKLIYIVKSERKATVNALQAEHLKNQTISRASESASLRNKNSKIKWDVDESTFLDVCENAKLSEVLDVNGKMNEFWTVECTGSVLLKTVQ